MRLDHLLAADLLGTRLSDPHREKTIRLMASFGLQATNGVFTLEDWLTVEDQDGVWRVHVQTPVPEHVLATVEAVCEGLVRAAGLVRLDVLSRREVSAFEWLQRLEAERRTAYRRTWL